MGGDYTPNVKSLGPTQVVPLFWPAVCFVVAASLKPAAISKHRAIVLLVATCAAVSVAVLVCEATGRRIRGRAVWLLVAIAAAMAGLLRGQVWIATLDLAQKYASLYPSSEHVFLITKSMGESRDYRKYAALRVDSTPEFSCLSGFLVYIKDEVPLGSVISVRGRVSVPKGPLNPGEFDNVSYLAGKGIYLEFRGYDFTVLTEDGRPKLGISARLQQIVGFARDSLEKAIDGSFPSEEAAILKGILLAHRAEMDAGDRIAFKRAGLYRFVGVSGFHIDAIYRLWEALAARVTKRKWVGQAVGFSGALALGCLSGWGPGASRAALCLCLRLVAPRLRRRYHPIAGLSLAAVLIGWRIPHALSDAGFVLSLAGPAGAWFGKRYVTPGVSRVMPRLSPLYPALGALILLVPAMALYFGEFTPAGFLLGGFYSGILLLLMPVTLGIMAFPHGAEVFGWIPTSVVRGLRVVAGGMGRIPALSFSVPAPNLWELVAYGTLLAVWAGYEQRRFWERGIRVLPGSLVERLRPWGPKLAMAAASLVLMVSAFLRAYALNPEIVFLAVGQGDCTLIRYKWARMMVDTGTSDAFDRVVAPYLRRRGIRRLDLLAISHFHHDHAGGLDAALREFCPETVIVPVGEAGPVQDLVMRQRTTHTQLTSRVMDLRAGQWLEVPGLEEDVRMIVVAPSGGAVSSAALVGHSFDENERCLVFALEFVEGGEAVLTVEFWGDAVRNIVQESLEAIRQQGGLRVIKVPHHGSRDSYCQGLFSLEEPSLAVIHVGPNSYGHPSKEVLNAAKNAGVPLFRTDIHGAVIVEMKRNRVTAVCFAPGGKP